MINYAQALGLGGLNPTAIAQQTKSNAQAIEQNKMQMESQRKIQELAPLAAQGNADAVAELYGYAPGIAQGITQRYDQIAAAQGAERANAIKQATGQFLVQYKQADPETRKQLTLAAEQNPLIDFDSEDYQAIESGNDMAVDFGIIESYGLDTYKQMFGGDKAITPYQQEQINLEKEKLDIRRLENEERALALQISRETNELKRQELEPKLEQNRANQEKAKRETEAQQESAIARFDNALETIKKIEGSQGFSAAIGARIPFIENLPGSDAQETIGLIDTLKSQSFLNEIEQMRGMGALSNAEGAKLESAISSLNRNMKEEAFKRSLQTIRDYFTLAKERAMKKMGIAPAVTEANNDPLGLGL